MPCSMIIFGVFGFFTIRRGGKPTKNPKKLLINVNRGVVRKNGLLTSYSSIFV